MCLSTHVPSIDETIFITVPSLQVCLQERNLVFGCQANSELGNKNRSCFRVMIFFRFIRVVRLNHRWFIGRIKVGESRLDIEVMSAGSRLIMKTIYFTGGLLEGSSNHRHRNIFLTTFRSLMIVPSLAPALIILIPSPISFLSFSFPRSMRASSAKRISGPVNLYSIQDHG